MGVLGEEAMTRRLRGKSHIDVRYISVSFGLGPFRGGMLTRRSTDEDDLVVKKVVRMIEGAAEFQSDRTVNC